MTTDKAYEVIIVGGGPAGLTAGLYCNRALLKTVLIEKGLLGGQIAISKDVENYPGVQGVMGFDLADKMISHARSYGLQVLEEEVMEVIPGPDVHSVRLASGEVLSAPALILAAGSTARKLNVPGEGEYLGSGVSYCATCDGFFFRDKTVIVVGGGDAAAEEALHLSRLVKKVYIIHRRNELRSAKILQHRVAAEPKVEIIFSTVVAEIKGDGRAVASVAVENTATGEKRELAADGVFIAIGHIPNNQVVPAAVKMNDWGFAITDERCETSVPGIFAAGDLRKKYASQIVVAAADGCIAALAAARYLQERNSGPGPSREGERE
jgi:thioredoxin reductase (NADPH)